MGGHDNIPGATANTPRGWADYIIFEAKIINSA